MSLASDSSETFEVIIIKFGMVIASDMLMHHVLILLTWTFIQAHTAHGNKKTADNFKTNVQASPIKFAVKIVRLKGLYFMIFLQSDDLTLHSRSQVRLKRDKC